MSTFLIHTQTIGGHQLEYLHHLYMGALKRDSDSLLYQEDLKGILRDWSGPEPAIYR